MLGNANDMLGSGFPVSSTDFWLFLCKFCGEADTGRLAGLKREFKTYRESTAHVVNLVMKSFFSKLNVFVCEYVSQLCETKDRPFQRVK